MENEENQNLNTTPLPVQQDIPPTPDPKKDGILKSKWLILGILILVILVPAGVFTLSKVSSKPTLTPTPAILKPTPTPNETSNWKTYTNGDIYFKYPSELNITKGEAEILLSDVTNAFDIPVKIPPKGHTLIEVSTACATIPTNFPLQDGATGQNPTIKSITINGFTGIRGTSSTSLGTADTLYLLRSGGVGCVFIQKQLGEERTFDQILSTFKFTDSTASDETANIIKDLNTALNPSDNPKFKLEVLKIAGNYANVSYTDIYGSGGVYFAMKQNGTWKKVWSGQNTPKCSDMQAYNIPKEIYGECQ